MDISNTMQRDLERGEEAEIFDKMDWIGKELSSFPFEGSMAKGTVKGMESFGTFWKKGSAVNENFGIRNGTSFQDFYMKHIRLDILFRKIGIRSGILFQEIGIRNGYVFEASMVRPRPKSGQVHPRAFVKN